MPTGVREDNRYCVSSNKSLLLSLYNLEIVKPIVAIDMFAFGIIHVALPWISMMNKIRRKNDRQQHTYTRMQTYFSLYIQKFKTGVDLEVKTCETASSKGDYRLFF